MRFGRALRLGVVAASIALGLGLALGASAADAQTDAVVRLQLDGVVDPFVADYLEGGIARAARDGAAAVLIEIDTPGGLSSSMRQITQAILNADVPVLCHVAPQGARAASAGAFVLLSCHVAAMAPGTNVGAATPVGLSGVVASEKAVNDAAASIRSIAEERGRNPDVAESFVRDAASISAQEALDRDIIDLIAPTTERLLTNADGTTVTLGDGDETVVSTAGVPIRDVGMAPFVGFIHQLLDPNLAFIFFWLGLALIVLELLVPGHVFSGTVGTILLILSVVSFGLLPVRLVGILLLVASVVFLLIELNAPGLGAWSIAGVASLVLGGLFLYNGAGGVRVSPLVIVPVAAAVTLFFGFVVTKVMSMRSLPPAQGPEAIVGKEGVVIGAGLSPEGIVRVAAEEWKARSSAGSAPAGARIRVTAIEGLVLTVEPVPAEHEGPPDDQHARAGTARPAEEGGNPR
jgi:membrane-bound serine protease (ClpP class)